MVWMTWVNVGMLHVMSFLSTVHQMAVSNNFLNSCSVDWLSSKQGLSAVIHKTAAGYSILRTFHFLCAFATATQHLHAVSFLLSYEYETDVCCGILLRPCRMFVAWCSSKFELVFVCLFALLVKAALWLFIHLWRVWASSTCTHPICRPNIESRRDAG